MVVRFCVPHVDLELVLHLLCLVEKFLVVVFEIRSSLIFVLYHFCHDVELVLVVVTLQFALCRFDSGNMKVHKTDCKFTIDFTMQIAPLNF